MIWWCPPCGQGFEDDVEVGSPRGTPEDRAPAHAVERLETHVAVLAWNARNSARVAAHQRRRAALREAQREQFFVAVAQRPADR
jgi:hypothetical protein